MTTKKITELPLATTLDGSEQVPVVQGGVLRRGAISDVRDLTSVLAAQTTATAQAVIATTKAGEAATSAAATANAVSLARGSRLSKAVVAAAGDVTRVKLLLTKDGAKVYKAGTTVGEIDSITPLIGPAGVLATNIGFVTWNGGGGASPVAPLRPVEDATGLKMTRETGFNLANGTTYNGIIANTGSRWALDFIFRTPPVFATYATVAAMNADVATFPVGAVIKVTGGPNWNGTPDLDDNIMGTVQVTYSTLQRGYWIKGNTTMGVFGSQSLLSVNGANGSYMQISIDARGQMICNIYSGTVTAVQTQVRTICRDVFALGNAGPQHFKIINDGLNTIPFLNGIEFPSWPTVAPFAPTSFSINNGTATGAGTSAVPRQAFSYTLDALCVTDGCDFTQQRAVSDLLAREFGTTEQRWSRVAYLWLLYDQSRFSQANGSTSTDLNRPDPVSNWQGELSPNVTNSSYWSFPSQELIPGLFTTRGLAYPTDIGAFNCFFQSSGNAQSQGSHTISGSSTETIEAGFAKQWFLDPTVANSDLYMLGITQGGASLELLQQKSSPPAYLYELLSNTLPGPQAGMYQREQCNRAVAAAAKRCRERGQVLRLIGIMKAQGETKTQTTAVAAANAKADMLDWYNNDLKYLLDTSGPSPIMAQKAISFSDDGTGNTRLSDDDEFRKLEALRDTTFRYTFFGGTAEWGGRFIHWPSVTVRRYGEVMGDRWRRLYLNGENAREFQVMSAVRSGGNIILTTNQPGEAVDQVLPAILSRLQTGGFDTFGLVFTPNASSAGRTFSANVTYANTGGVLVITVPISGGGPIAGDVISVTGAGARWTNFRQTPARVGLYRDQNWGTIPFAASSPAFDPTGAFNVITPYLSPSIHTLA